MSDDNLRNGTTALASGQGVPIWNLVKNIVNNIVKNIVINIVKNIVFPEAEAVTRNLVFLGDGDLKTLAKRDGDN